MLIVVPGNHHASLFTTDLSLRLLWPSIMSYSSTLAEHASENCHTPSHTEKARLSVELLMSYCQTYDGKS